MCRRQSGSCDRFVIDFDVGHHASCFRAVAISSVSRVTEQRNHELGRAGTGAVYDPVALSHQARALTPNAGGPAQRARM